MDPTWFPLQRGGTTQGWDPRAGSPQPVWEMGPGEPTVSHRTGFLPGSGLKLKEKYYDNWQVVCITSFVKKSFQKNETSLHPWEKKSNFITREESKAAMPTGQSPAHTSDVRAPRTLAMAAAGRRAPLHSPETGTAKSAALPRTNSALKRLQNGLEHSLKSQGTQ